MQPQFSGKSATAVAPIFSMSYRAFLRFSGTVAAVGSVADSSGFDTVLSGLLVPNPAPNVVPYTLDDRVPGKIGGMIL